jgi:CRP-like cAMP-binding protein
MGVGVAKPGAQEKSLFAGLGPEEEKRLLAASKPVACARGDIIFAQGEPVSGIWSVEEGAVRVSQAEGGKTVLVRVAGAGDTVGHRSVFTHAAFQGTAIAMLDSSLLFVPKEALLALLGTSPEFSLRLIRRMARDLDLFEANQAALRTGSIDHRLGLLLGQLAESHGIKQGRGAVRIELPLSRADLAAMVGVAEETVIRGLASLRRRGLISEQNSRILVKNAARKDFV